MFGQLGDGTNNDQYLPVMVLGGLSNVTQISAAYAHSLAVSSISFTFCEFLT